MAFPPTRYTATQRIAAKRWDVVVLQDCSTCPLEHIPAFRWGVEQMVKFVRDVGSKPLLYMTWADVGRSDDQREIARRYLEIGSRLNVDIAPVGLAWEQAQTLLPNVKFHEPDDHHAALAGTQLTAYVFLRMFGARLDAPLTVDFRQPPMHVFQLFSAETVRYTEPAVARQLWEIAEQVVNAQVSP